MLIWGDTRSAFRSLAASRLIFAANGRVSRTGSLTVDSTSDSAAVAAPPGDGVTRPVPDMAGDSLPVVAARSVAVTVLAREVAPRSTTPSSCASSPARSVRKLIAEPCRWTYKHWEEHGVGARRRGVRQAP